VLLHKREKNSFGAIFTENYYISIEKLMKMGNCESEFCINMSYGELNNMRMSSLEGMLVLEIIQVSDYEYFFTFWGKYADALEGVEALQMAEWIGRLQLKMPLEYAEMTRNLRMRLELKF